MMRGTYFTISYTPAGMFLARVIGLHGAPVPDLIKT